MGIIHRNILEHGVRICHFVAAHNLGFADVRLCGIGESRISDHLHFYSNLDPALLSVAAHFQLNCFKALTIFDSGALYLKAPCLWQKTSYFTSGILIHRVVYAGETFACLINQSFFERWPPNQILPSPVWLIESITFINASFS